MGETIKNKDADKAKSPPRQGQEADRELDQELEDTFPASDPPSATQRDDAAERGEKTSKR